MVIVAIPIAIIFLQGDWGTAFVFIVIIVGILFAARLKWQAIATGLIGSGVAVVVAVFFSSSGQKDPFRQARLLNFFGLTSENILAALNIDPTVLQRFDTMQVDNAKMAIGSGGLTGKGFFQPGSFVQLNYLPADHTDFVFSSGIEAVGFVGGMVILLLYFALIVRALVHAYQARDNLGYFIIIGVVAMEMAHIFENIGMNLGVMPVTGIPLPFMSYGGSSMWTNMIAFGLVINVAMRKPGKRYRKASQAPLSVF